MSSRGLQTINSVLERYDAVLTHLEHVAKSSPDKRRSNIRFKDSAASSPQEQRVDVILRTLHVRDAVQQALMENPQAPPAQFLLLSQLDERLRRQASWIADNVSLANWRASFGISDNIWCGL